MKTSRAMVLPLLLLAWPVQAGLSVDGGRFDRRWHGSGTGSIMSDTYAGPLAAAGLIAIEVRDAAGRIVEPLALVAGMDLVSISQNDVQDRKPVVRGGIAISRRVRLRDQDGARLFDEFTNTTFGRLSVRLVWAGQSAQQPALKTDPGLLRLTDSSGSVMVVAGPAAYRLVDTEMLPGTGPYPGADPANWGLEYSFDLEVGETRSLLLFTLQGPSTAHAGGVAALERAAQDLLARPDVAGLPANALARAVNWRSAAQADSGSGGRIDVARASLAEIRAAILEGRIGARDVLRIYRGRIAALDREGPSYNAFLYINPDAESEAEKLDALSPEEKRTLPLIGAVIAVKDNIAVAGMPLTLGVDLLRAIRAAKDAPVVARLRAAGALIIGKTNLDELTSGVFGISGAGGQTLNPYASGRAPSGSSSGSAVAVATRMAGGALGTDTWASILAPSAEAGIVGVRPGEGVVPLEGVFPGHPRHDVLGPMAASAEDAALLLSVLADRPFEKLKAPASIRLGLLARPTADPGARLADPPLKRALDSLQTAGATIVDTPFDPSRHYHAVRQAMLEGDAYANEHNFLAGLPGIDAATVEAILGGTDAVRPSPRGRRDDFQAIAASPPRQNTAAERQGHARAMAGLRTALVTLMNRARVDALVMSTILGPPALIGSSKNADENSRFSAWSGLPAVTVPCGTLEGASWPAGMLLVGRPGSEMDLLAIAAEIQRQQRKEPIR